MILLGIDGAVSVPRNFRFGELAQLAEQVTERSVLLGGRAIRGVRLGALMDKLGIKPWARFAVIRGHDGYAANIAVDMLADCVLVYGVGDHPLPAELGGHFRIQARALGRCANVKNVATVSFAVEPAKIEHACPHELARTRGAWVPLVGGKS